MRTKPAKNAADKVSRDKLTTALDNYLRANDLPEQTVAIYGVNPEAGAVNVPDKEGLGALAQVLRNPTKFASHGPSSAGNSNYDVNINPNADRVLFAHELGHIASKQQGLGQAVAGIRDNDALMNALLAASVLAPGTAAALTDEDNIATQLGLAYALQSPMIMDEILANKHALNLMDIGNMRATMGQRGKMAGGLMTYLSFPLLAAGGGGMVGNAIESQLAG